MPRGEGQGRPEPSHDHLMRADLKHLAVRVIAVSMAGLAAGLAIAVIVHASQALLPG